MKTIIIGNSKDKENINNITDFLHVSEEKFDWIIDLYIPSKDSVIENEIEGHLVNLGIYQSNDKTYTNKYVGYSWLKDEKENIMEKDGNRYAIHIIPRFGLSIQELLDSIIQEGDDQDDELIDYLYLESSNPAEKMITFFFDEELIDNVNKDDAFNGALFSVVIYVSLLYKLLKRNMLRKIFKNEANYVGKIRGKICMNKQISKNLATGHQERIYCKYNERSEDILENQILKYALKMADEYLQENKFLNDELQKKISWCRNKFSNVSEVKCDRNDILKVKRNIPNFYKEYISVLDFAKIIIENEAIMDTGKNETISIVPYAINMPLLYECYVRSRIKRFLKTYENECYEVKLLKYVKTKNNKNGYDEEVYGAKKVASKPCYIDGWIFPDIVLKYVPIKDDTNTKENEKNKQVFYRVYDVKYKDLSSNSNSNGIRDDRLQILAYNKMYKTDNNTGFIAPKISEAINENFVSLNGKNIIYAEFEMHTNNKSEEDLLLEEAIKV